MTTKDAYIVPGLIRGLSVLRAFGPKRPDMSLNEIAEALGISKSAAFRTVHTLVHEGYLLSVPGQTRYRLGPAVMQLTYGYYAGRELLEVANPVLERLRDLTDWSTHLGVLDGRHVLYLLRFPATQGLSSLVHVGSRLPAASTSMGRVMMCPKSEAAVRRIFAGTPANVIEHILETRKKDATSDLVVSIGNFESGLCSVAAPVRDLSGEVIAAISATRMTDRVPDALIDQVRMASDRISSVLGYSSP